MNGVACIRGLRIPVATVVGMIAEGMTQDDILRAFPDLQAEDFTDIVRLAEAHHRLWASLTPELRQFVRPPVG